MKKQILGAALIGVLGLTQNTLAGGEDHGPGNGGMVVQCPGQEPEVLDLHVGRILWNLHPVSWDDSRTWQEIALKAIRPYEHTSPLEYLRIRALLKEFEETAFDLAGTHFSSTNDARTVAIAKDCSIVQAVIQRQPEVHDDSRYFRNEDIWNALSEIQKAALALHEVFYGIAISEGAKDSYKVQNWVATLMSQKVEQKSNFITLYPMTFRTWLTNFRINDFGTSEYEFILDWMGLHAGPKKFQDYCVYTHRSEEAALVVIGRDSPLTAWEVAISTGDSPENFKNLRKKTKNGLAFPLQQAPYRMNVAKYCFDGSGMTLPSSIGQTTTAKDKKLAVNFINKHPSASCWVGPRNRIDYRYQQQQYIRKIGSNGKYRVTLREKLARARYARLAKKREKNEIMMFGESLDGRHLGTSRYRFFNVPASTFDEGGPVASSHIQIPCDWLTQ